MNRRLRRRHLTLGVPALALAPAALLLALAVRPRAPANPALPRTAHSARLIPVPGLPVELELTPEGDLIAFRPTRPLRVPDPLLYWTPSAPQNTSMPARAVLLGPLDRGRVTAARLPSAATGRGGFLLIWDGGHRRPVAWAAAEVPPDGRSAP
jgi:hypothetical protein